MIGLAADLALLSAVLCTACTRSSVGVHFALSACQQSARPPASIHDEIPQYGFLLYLPNSAHKQTTNDITPRTSSETCLPAR